MKLNRKSLEVLCGRSLPAATFEDLFKVSDDCTDACDLAEINAIRERVNAYLADFLKPNRDGSCVNCGEVQGGSVQDIAAVILGKSGRFKWGLAHGEGYCGKCGYPGRAKHYIGEGKDEIRIPNLILQYKPDVLSFDKSNH